VKVLFVGGGRRVELAQQFKSRGHTIDAYELNQYVPIATEAENVIEGYSWDDPRFSEHLLSIEKDYDLILPLHDGAVEAMSATRSKAATATDWGRLFQKFCVSNKEAVAVSCDKTVLAEELRMFGWYPKPKLFKPAIIKPAKGFSSKGIRRSRCWLGFTPKNHVVQRFIPGGKEYTVDCYFDFQSKLVDWVPRRRLEVVGGEVTKSITVAQNVEIYRILWRLERSYCFRGPVTVQVIEEEQKDGTKKFFLMEVNARFGGGATLSIAAGFDMIKLLELECERKEIITEYEREWREGVYLTRSYRDAVFDMSIEQEEKL